MKSVNRRNSVHKLTVLLGLFSLCLFSCANLNLRSLSVRSDESPPVWADNPASGWNPDAQPLVVFSSGMGRVGLNVQFAEREAHGEAIRGIRDTLESVVQSLNTVLVASLQDRIDRVAGASLSDNQMFVQEFITEVEHQAEVVDTWQGRSQFYLRLQFDITDEVLGAYASRASSVLSGAEISLTVEDKEVLLAAARSIVSQVNTGAEGE